MKWFRRYLEKQGLTHLEGLELEKERQAYQKTYAREYMRQRRKKHQSIELLFTQESFALIKVVASKYDLKPTTYCKQLVESSIGNVPMELNKELIESVIIEIKRVGNLINQITRKINATSTVYPSQLQSISQLLERLEQEVQAQLEQPHVFVDDHQDSQ